MIIAFLDQTNDTARHGFRPVSQPSLWDSSALAGCSGAGLQDVGALGPLWQRAAQEQPGIVDLEDGAATRRQLFTPAPFPGQAQEERWRCEVGWRCYATDPETRERTELLRSGTAWWEDSAPRPWVCSQARDQAQEADCKEGIPHYEELEVDRDCDCTRQ